MPERVTALDAAFLALDATSTPGQLGSVYVFDADGPDGDRLDDDRLHDLIAERIAFAPRYRQKVRSLPAQLAAPVWVDDEDFDLGWHLRRTTLPIPGTDEQLQELVSGLLATPLDRSRPLWEVHLVRGLERDRLALVTKTHASVVDGLDTVDLAQVLLDSTPGLPIGPPAAWHPQPAPPPGELLARALWQSGRDPGVALDNARTAFAGAAQAAGQLRSLLAGLDLLPGDVDPDPRSAPTRRWPWTGPVTGVRDVAMVALPLAELRAARARHDTARHDTARHDAARHDTARQGSGQHDVTVHDVTVHDVVLAVLSGALRQWLEVGARLPGPGAALTALVPMAVVDDGGEPTSLGTGVEPRSWQLPVGEPDPVLRLHQLAFGTRTHRHDGRAVPASDLTALAGFAPPTLHALGARTLGDVRPRPPDLLVSSAPGPPQAVHAAGSPLLASWPVLPLAPGVPLAVGVTSYRGTLYVGLHADRGAVEDLDVLAAGLPDALRELGRRRPTPVPARGRRRRNAGAR